MTYKHCILLGPPGAGVKAQAKELAERWQVSYISSDQLMGEAAATQSSVGLAARPHLVAGELIPDALSLKLIQQRFEHPDVMLKGWVLEGFPRTLVQARAFDEWLTAVGLPAATLVHLKARTGLLINRLWQASGQTENTAAIRQRLTRYEEETAPLLEYYQQRSQLTTLNANLSFAEVARELFQLGQDETGAAPLIRDEAELDSLLQGEPLLVVDGMASWCSPCKLVTPLIDQLAEAYCDRVKVVKMDFDANQQIPKRFGLKGMPAVMFFKDGELRETLTGVKPYQTYSATVSRFLE